MKEVKPFQSTRPIRGATLFLLRSRHSSDISIHAPHTERDPRFLAPLPPGSYFNPRAPYGARPEAAQESVEMPIFQSTRPIRGATLDAVAGIYLP